MIALLVAGRLTMLQSTVGLAKELLVQVPCASGSSAMATTAGVPVALKAVCGVRLETLPLAEGVPPSIWISAEGALLPQSPVLKETKAAGEARPVESVTTAL